MSDEMTKSETVVDNRQAEPKRKTSKLALMSIKANLE